MPLARSGAGDDRAAPPSVFDPTLTRAAAHYQDVDPATVRAILAAARKRGWRRGDSLIREGAPTDHLIHIVDGTTKISEWGSDGQEAIIGFPGPGTTLGLVCVVACTTPIYSASAVTAVDGIVLPGSVARRLMAESSTFAAHLARELAGWVQKIELERRGMVDKDVTTRVLRRLVELVDGWGVVHDGHVDVELPLTQAELSSWAAVSRESTTRVLHGLRQDGIVITSRCGLAVLDVEALRDRYERRRLELHE
jgi:CRP/FNR family transcriptional regulator, cyclic AMP receptor protein